MIKCYSMFSVYLLMWLLSFQAFLIGQSQEVIFLNLTFDVIH